MKTDNHSILRIALFLGIFILCLVKLSEAIILNPNLIDIPKKEVINLLYSPKDDSGNYMDFLFNPNVGTRLDYTHDCNDFCSGVSFEECIKAADCDSIGGQVKYICIVYKVGNQQTLAGTCLRPVGFNWDNGAGSVITDNDFLGLNKFPGLLYMVVSNDNKVETKSDNTYYFIRRSNGYLLGQAPKTTKTSDPLHAFNVSIELDKANNKAVIDVKQAYDDEGNIIGGYGPTPVHIGLTITPGFEEPMIKDSFFASGKQALGKPLSLSYAGHEGEQIYVFVNGFMEGSFAAEKVVSYSSQTAAAGEKAGNETQEPVAEEQPIIETEKPAEEISITDNGIFSSTDNLETTTQEKLIVSNENAHYIIFIVFSWALIIFLIILLAKSRARVGKNRKW